MAADDSATLRLRERENFGDRYVEVRAWSVPESERYPDGVKYSFQYGTQDGRTLVRYDNFPDHPEAAHHHKYTPMGVEDADFDGLRPLYPTILRMTWPMAVEAKNSPNPSIQLTINS